MAFFGRLRPLKFTSGQLCSRPRHRTDMGALSDGLGDSPYTASLLSDNHYRPILSHSLWHVPTAALQAARTGAQDISLLLWLRATCLGMDSFLASCSLSSMLQCGDMAWPAHVMTLGWRRQLFCIPPPALPGLRGDGSASLPMPSIEMWLMSMSTLRSFFPWWESGSSPLPLASIS